MSETQNGRVAVYLDFDNIVLSWYDRVHGRNSFARDRQRIAEDPTAPDVAERLRAAVVDVGAIIDYASSFGTLVLTRAYADWSAPINAEYRSQLVSRAVDLVQLFPAAAYAKNGADIRLAVDTVEDMFRLSDLTHVVIVAGDSDYVPLAQRCKRLGRYVVGIGVAGSTAKALTAACDEFATYDSLPGISLQKSKAEAPQAARSSQRKKQAPSAPEIEVGSAGATGSGSGSGSDPEVASRSGAAAASGSKAAGSAQSSRARASQGTPPVSQAPHDEPLDAFDVFDGLDDENESDGDTEFAVTGLLIRALLLGQEKDDSGWLHSSAVKQQMRRMDPSFNEKALGFRSFSEFLKSRVDVAELEESGHERLVRLRDQNS